MRRNDASNKCDLGSAQNEYFIEHRTPCAIDAGPWKGFVIERITRTIHDDDLAAFVGQLQRAPWLLGDDWVAVQNRLIELASANDRGKFIAAFLDLETAASI
ncbi:hypothetical protein [Bradyrhizobium sp.]|uniref:hypothetical protein n=1 Tax=Bradyrhizobium sp. TaxID=376 RepID=UPI003C3D7E7C